MPDKRQSGGLLLIFGYVGVVAGTVAFIVSYWYERFPEETVAYVALGLGIGLAGLACWRWTISCRSLGVDPVVTRSSTHWMAAAALVLAAFPGALTYQVYGLHRQFSHQATPEYPHYRLIISGGSGIHCRSSPRKSWLLGSRECTRNAKRRIGIKHYAGAFTRWRPHRYGD